VLATEKGRKNVPHHKKGGKKRCTGQGFWGVKPPSWRKTTKTGGKQGKNKKKGGGWR